MRRLGVLLVLLAAAACAKNSNPAVATPPPGSAAPSTVPRTGASIVVTSTAFAANTDIPVKYTCQGSNTLPPLSWTNVPPGAKELALVMFDPDAPNGGFLQRTCNVDGCAAPIVQCGMPDSVTAPSRSTSRPEPRASALGVGVMAAEGMPVNISRPLEALR